MYFCVYMHICFHIMWICYLLKNQKKNKIKRKEKPNKFSKTHQFCDTHFRKHYDGKNGTNVSIVFKNSPSLWPILLCRFHYILAKLSSFHSKNAYQNSTCPSVIQFKCWHLPKPSTFLRKEFIDLYTLCWWHSTIIISLIFNMFN